MTTDGRRTKGASLPGAQRPVPLPGPHGRAALALIVLLAALASLPMAGPTRADAPNAREIMARAYGRDEGDNQTARVRMTLIDKDGKRSERRIELFRKRRGGDILSLLFFLAPGDVAGSGLLTYDYGAPGRLDDLWLYRPAQRHARHIGAAERSGAFMGSDFNYSDLTRPDLEDYAYTLMKEEDRVLGARTWQIQAVPRNREVSRETGYDKSILWVRQDNYVVVRAVRWVRASPRLKYMQVRRLERIDGIWVPGEIEMRTLEGRRLVHTTVLRLQNVRFNQALSEAQFTVRALEQGP